MRLPASGIEFACEASASASRAVGSECRGRGELGGMLNDRMGAFPLLPDRALLSSPEFPA